MPPLPFEQHNDIAISDQRDSERYPSDHESAYVWVSLQRRVKVTILDKSEGGIGIVVDSREPFEAGFSVRVEFAGKRRTATVVYVREIESDQIQIGLAWA